MAVGWAGAVERQDVVAALGGSGGAEEVHLVHRVVEALLAAERHGAARVGRRLAVPSPRGHRAVCSGQGLTSH